MKEGEGYYIPIGHAEGQAAITLRKSSQALKPIFENEKLAKVGHNAKYDMAVLHEAGIEVRGLKLRHDAGRVPDRAGMPRSG